MSRPDRVTDLSTSKKLVKWMGGVETEKCHQTTLDCDMNVVWHIVDRFLNGFERTEGTGEVPVVPAYTTDDLLERLPDIIEHKGNFFSLKIDFATRTIFYFLKGVGVLDHGMGNRGIKHFLSKATLINEMSELVIFCGENNYLPVVEL